MNFLCSSDPENEFLEAMNTLEREKIKERENINKPKVFQNNKNQNNKVKEKETLNNKNNLNNNNISSKHEKKSSILEIIDYPYMENKNNNLNKNSKINSDLTDINCETQLYMEYTKNYMFTLNKGNYIKNNENKYENNNKFINNNLTNRNNINKNEEENIDNKNNSSNSLIINNDYNVSIISNTFLNNELEHNHKPSIKNNNNNNFINIKYNPKNKRKIDKNRKNSIPFTKTRYSNDTI